MKSGLRDNKGKAGERRSSWGLLNSSLVSRWCRSRSRWRVENGWLLREQSNILQLRLQEEVVGKSSIEEKRQANANDPTRSLRCQARI